MFLDTLLGLEGIYSSVNYTLLTFIMFPSENIYVLLVSALEKAMAPHSSTLAWKIPWTEGPGRLQSMGR